MEAAQARLSLHLSKCHIFGYHMSRLNYNLMLSANKSGSDASMYIYENTIKFKGVSVLIRHQFLCITKCFDTQIEPSRKYFTMFTAVHSPLLLKKIVASNMFRHSSIFSY